MKAFLGYSNIYDYCGATDKISASCENASSTRKDKSWVDILTNVKHFIPYFKKKMFCTEWSWLRHFNIICNADEYRMMDQDLGLGQLYNVQT